MLIYHQPILWEFKHQVDDVEINLRPITHIMTEYPTEYRIQ